MSLNRRSLLQQMVLSAVACRLPAASTATLADQSLLGQPAPKVDRTTLDGRRISLHDLRGRVTLVNFWASWCAPCLAEMPVFAQWMVQLGGRGLEVIGVSMDDDLAPVRTVVAGLHLDYPMLRGDAALARSFGGVLGLPVSFLIDRQGIVRGRFDGAANLKALHRELLSLLG